MARKMILYNIVQKSNALVVLLFLLAIAGSANSFIEEKSDTIIIDGKLVVVNRVVEYDDGDEPEKPKHEPRTDRRFSWGLNVLPNYIIGSVKGTGDMQSLGQFVNKDWKGELGFDGSINVRMYDDYDVFYSLGVGYSLFKFNNDFFSISELDDSLWRFETLTDGDLTQITLHRFDIGSETDTLAVELKESDITLTAFRVPMSIGWYLPDGKSANARVVEAGLVHHFVATKTGGPVVLLNENAETQFQIAENLGVRSYGLSAFVAGGWKWRLTGVGRRDKVSASIRGYIEAPLLGVTDNSAGVGLRYFKAGLQLCLNVFVPDKD